MSLKGTTWAPMGPSPISENTTQDNGLVSAIAINPNNPNVIYQGTAGGGLWGSIDGGTTWSPLFDRQLSLGIGEPGALAIDPNNTGILYAGTSSRVTNQPAAGLFKSTDGGASWVLLGSGYPAGNSGNATQFINQNINVILVDPADSNILYLGSNSGLFVSFDGGLNWTAGANGSGDARSLVLDTSLPLPGRILYAGLSGLGVFQSTDGGQTWNQIVGASTPAVASAVGSGGFSKAIVAIPPPATPANTNGVQVIYVTLQGTGGAPDPVGIFLSTDQGATWAQQAATGMPTNSQGGYSFHMAVDPASPGDGVNDLIYFGVVRQAKSTNSGVSFTPLNVLHADTHSWAFFPQPSPTPSIVFCGNDGGLDKSVDGGATWTPLNSGGLQTGLFYNLEIRPDATGSVTVGALQDNEVETTSGGTGLGWVATFGGDGWDVAYDATTPGRVYASSGFWSPPPCTQVYLSNDDGATFPTNITPWGTTTDGGCYLAPVATDPSTGGIVYVSGSQNLWQSRDGGLTWRILASFGNTGNIDVARANGNNVVIAVGTQVFVSTNALAATVGSPNGVTFTNITRNLPSRNVSRAVFDPNDPTVIYAVLGGFAGVFGQPGHVFRTSVAATAWTDISPVLDLPFNAVALDGTETPTAIYAGTDLGVLRSVDGGASWSVLDDIHFPRAPVLDLALSTQAGILRAATYGRGVFQFTAPTGPAIAVSLQDGLDFGFVCQGPVYLTLEITNVGAANLVVESVQRLMGSTDFAVLSSPGTPLVISPTDTVDFVVQFTPTSQGTPETATIRIKSNDPAAPYVDLAATGQGGTASLATVIATGGNLGEVCLGSFVDRTLTLNNTGLCSLSILNIVSSSGVFTTPSVASYPLIVGSGESIGVPIRFQPIGFGPQSATITVFSNDPAGPRTLTVSGVALTPKLDLLIADAGSFGKVCLGTFADRFLTLSNGGRCRLSVTSITSSSGEFSVPLVVSYPLAIAAGGALSVPIRFQPTGFGPQAATITVVSDDPGGPRTIAVSGEAPHGRLAVTGSTDFGGVRYRRRAQRTVSICNVGECDLDVTRVALRHRHRRFRLIHNPFPAKLRPGSSLDVVIQFRATRALPRLCELIVMSDDPVTPIRTLDVLAYTRYEEGEGERR